MVKSIELNSCDEMVTFMDKVSDERYEVGFELHEVQTAINIMEESLWKMISEFVDSDKKTAAMKQVSCLLGKAKQELAHEYAMLSKEYVSS